MTDERSSIDSPVTGEPAGETLQKLRAHEGLPAPVRLMGDGWEPHVEEVAGRLIYSLPVESGLASRQFAFSIERRDVDVLLADAYRRATLEVVAHAVLQDSMQPGSPEVTELDFRILTACVLHARPDELASFVSDSSRRHHLDVEHYVREAMARRGAAPGERSPANS